MRPIAIAPIITRVAACTVASSSSLTSVRLRATEKPGCTAVEGEGWWMCGAWVHSGGRRGLVDVWSREGRAGEPPRCGVVWRRGGVRPCV
eukprot:2602103-Prymnesium_polylepis.1